MEMSKKVRFPPLEATLVIILGASDYPKAQGLDNKAFENSAKAFKKYLISEVGLPVDNLLDLFNSEVDAPQQENDIERFLRERIAALQGSRKPIQDVICYYVGHGGFNQNEDYHLFIRDSQEPGLASTKLQIKSFAWTLKENARFLRRIVILDCCFAACAQQAFGSSQVGVKGPGHDDPTRGTSLLCASSQGESSKSGPHLTQFTEALLYVLNYGDTSSDVYLTLRKVKKLMENFLKQKYPKDNITLEVHSPDQHEGDVADVNLFPNLAHGELAATPSNSAQPSTPHQAVKQQTRRPRVWVGGSLAVLLIGLVLVLLLVPEVRAFFLSPFSSSPSSLIPSTWTVQFNDPLLASKHQKDWENDGCSFSGPGGVFEQESSGLGYCVYGSSTDHAWGDLAYQVQVAIHQGDWAGLAVRLRSNNYYYFEISRGGTWVFKQHISSNGGDDIVIRPGSSAAIHRGADQWNTLLIIAQGSTFQLWINGQQVASPSVSSLIPAGTIGVVTGTGNSVSSISWFRNALLRTP